MYKITKETLIEKDIEYIIDTFHKPLPDFVEVLNEKWYTFFYNCMHNEKLWHILKTLKEKFFTFSSRMLEHIDEEEENEFPLLIEYSNNKKNLTRQDEEIIKKITEDHNNFEKEFYFMDEELKKIDINDWDECYKEYNELLDIFNKYKNDSLEHIQAEIELIEKFYEIIKSRD